jgi:hypothetical protein
MATTEERTRRVALAAIVASAGAIATGLSLGLPLLALVLQSPDLRCPPAIDSSHELLFSRVSPCSQVVLERGGTVSTAGNHRSAARPAHTVQNCNSYARVTPHGNRRPRLGQAQRRLEHDRRGTAARENP